MKRLLIFIMILFTFCFSACSTNFTPFKPQTAQSKRAEFFNVYVFGAVQNEGYVQCVKGTTYENVIFLAGILPQTVLPNNLQQMVSAPCQIALQYWQDGIVYDCINLNGGIVLYRIYQPNVPNRVIDALADYLQQNGKISDKTLLVDILGQDYSDNFYKFFVSESDYEKVD